MLAFRTIAVSVRADQPVILDSARIEPSRQIEPADDARVRSSRSLIAARRLRRPHHELVKNSRVERQPVARQLGQLGRPDSARSGSSGSRLRGSLPDRDSPCRRSPPSPSTPGWCRCCWSLFRGGCAARAFAASSTKPRLPSLSRVTPASRPGICRTKTVCASPANRRTARRSFAARRATALPPSTTSAPKLARRLQQAQRNRIACRRPAAPPAACASSAIAAISSIAAEEIRILHDQAGEIVAELPAESSGRRHESVGRNRQLDQIDRRARRCTSAHLAIARMHRAGHDDRACVCGCSRRPSTPPSASAVAPSYIEALATSMPKSAATID